MPLSEHQEIISQKARHKNQTVKEITTEATIRLKQNLPIVGSYKQTTRQDTAITRTTAKANIVKHVA